MSASSSESSDPVLSIIGKVFIFAVPAVFVVMLGIVGIAFLGNSGIEKTEDAAETAAAAPAAAAPAAAPAPAATPAAAEETADAAPAAVAAGGAGEIDPKVMALGKTSYATCMACHGMDGKGLPAGPALMAPSLVGSELLLGDPDAALLIILKGIAKENMDFMGVMAPLAAGLDDEKMAAVLTYTRNSWGNSAPAVTVEEAAAAREKYSGVDAPTGVKRSEILSIVEAHK